MRIELFKQKNFSLLILGAFVSNFGTIMQQFAISLYVLNKTGSGIAFASVMTVSIIPQIVLGPFVGVFVDRINRLKAIIICDFISFLIITSAAVYFSVVGNLSLSVVYLISMLLSSVNTVFQPASATMFPTLIDKKDLLDANVVRSFFSSFSSITGPLLAGIIYFRFGLMGVFILNAISFLLSGISEMFIKSDKITSHVPTKKDYNFFEEFKLGYYYVIKNTVIKKIILVSAIANFSLAALLRVILPFSIKSTFMSSDFQFALYSSVIMFGALLAPFLVKRLTKNSNIGSVISYTLLMISGLVLAITLNLWYAIGHGTKTEVIHFALQTGLGLMLLIVVGIHNISVATLFQKSVPIELLGRVGTLFMTTVLICAPLGQMIYGLLLNDSQIVIATGSVVVITFMTSLVFGFKRFENIVHEETVKSA